MPRGNLFVISGPSGAGKGTLVTQIKDIVPNLWVSTSVTTRPPRPGEQDGVEYFFKTEDEFSDLVKNNKLLEWARYSDHCYGTPLREVQKHIDAGDQVVLEIDVQGAAQIKEKIPDAVLIFVEPPSLRELERRLRTRSTEDEEAIQKRLRTARVELSRKMDYDMRLVNDDLQTAARELGDYINARAQE